MFLAYRDILQEKGLKVTPQRLAVLDALSNLKIHPTTDNITDFIKKNHPSIAVGTIYRTLETFVEKGIVNKVNTNHDVMRYDAVLKRHHHLYCEKSEKIEDFYDEEFDKLVSEYLQKKEIPGFKMKDFKVQITGQFSDIAKGNKE